jgi:hypothetical protein
MQLYLRRYWCPKRGSAEREYEDAIAAGAGPAFPRRLAIADGASESSFARLWATLLVDAYAGGALTAGTLLDGLAPLQQRWHAEVTARPLPWYASEKARAGAFAALVGLTLHEDGTWQAVAAGDCCTLHLRADRLLCSFPLESAAAFDNRPRLLSSNPERNQGLDADIRHACGRFLPGDAFLLMSDALAAHVLRRLLDERCPLARTLPFRRPRAFRRWVEARRNDRSLRNDDVSLLWVEVS